MANWGSSGSGVLGNVWWPSLISASELSVSLEQLQRHVFLWPLSPPCMLWGWLFIRNGTPADSQPGMGVYIASELN